MPAVETTVARIDDQPTVAAARAALAPIIKRDDELDTTLRGYLTTLDSFSAMAQERSVTAEERLLAEANLASTRVELARTRLERRRLETELERVRDVEREKARAAFHTKKQAAVAVLKAKLVAAQAANEALKAMQTAEHEALGEPFENLAWFELNTGDGSTRFDQWLTALRSYHLLDE